MKTRGFFSSRKGKRVKRWGATAGLLVGLGLSLHGMWPELGPKKVSAQSGPLGLVQLSLGNNFPSTAPIDFQLQRAQGEADFQACVNQKYGEAAAGAINLGLAASVSDGGLNLFGAGVDGNAAAESAIVGTIASQAAMDPTTQCPDFGEVEGEVSCRQLKSGGLFDLENLDRVLNRNKKAVVGLACKRGKLAGARGRIECLGIVSRSIREAISALKRTFLERIQEMQKGIQQIDELIATRQDQIDELNRILGGGPGGKAGLLAERERLQEIVNNLPGEIQAVKDQLDALEQRRQTFAANLNAERRSRATQCFRDLKRSNFRCTKNGPVVTAREYLECRYEQDIQIVNGQRQRGVTVENKAKASRDQLASVLDRIGGGEGSFDDLNDEFPTIADVERKFGSELRSFDRPGFSIHDFVISALGRCYNRAERAIARDRDRGGGSNPQAQGVGQGQNQIEADQRALRARLQQMFTQQSVAFANATSAMVGTALILDTSVCRNASLDQQVECLEDIQENQTGLVTGGTPNAQGSIFVQGIIPEASFELQFNGMQDLATKGQEALRFLERDVRDSKRKKREFVLAARQQAEGFVQQMAELLGAPNSVLNEELERINSGLAAELTNGVRLDSVDPAVLEFDPNTGLPIPPRDLDAVIGSQMTPPLLDVNSASFTNAQSEISGQLRGVDRDLNSAEDSRRLVLAQSEECVNEDLEDITRRIQQNRDQWDNLQCQRAKNTCGAAESDTVARLSSDAENVVEEFGVNTSFSGAAILVTAVAGMCLDDDGANRYDFDGDGVEDGTQADLEKNVRAAERKLALRQGKEEELQNFRQLRQNANQTYQNALNRINSLQSQINSLMLQAQNPRFAGNAEVQIEELRTQIQRIRDTEEKDALDRMTRLDGMIRLMAADVFELKDGAPSPDRVPTSVLQGRVDRLRELTGEQSRILPNGARCEQIARTISRDVERVKELGRGASGIAERGT